MSVFLAVDRDDRERTMGYGVQFPSGTVVIEWDRKAWPEDQRLEFEHVSIYGSVPDAIQAGQIKVRWLKRSNFLKQPIDMDIDDLRVSGGGADDAVAVYTVSDGRRGPRLQLHRKACEAVGLEEGDQVLVYPEGDELRLVPSDEPIERIGGHLIRTSGIVGNGQEDDS